MPDNEQTQLIAAIKALCAEPLYENRRKEDGVSVRFLGRMAILKYRAGLSDADDPLVRESLLAFAEEEGR